MPSGSRLDLDRSVRTFRDGTVLVGGHPGRVITLSPEGASTLSSLLTDGTASEVTARLADRLVRAGMAHPRPADGNTSEAGRSLTVVVPVRDRSHQLDRCLESLGSAVPVVVVDDASHHPAAVAEVCRRHRARLIVRTRNGGPAMARNDALATIDTELIAFVDSDCTVTEGWLGRLVRLFDDPDIAAVAPRVRPRRSGPTPGRSTLARFSEGRSPLDLGPDPSEVGPDRLVRYVPGASLVVRRSALGEGFDAGLRVGEDVDLVWRLLAEGWRVRFEPSVEVFHQEPTSWKGWLARRYRYGTSAGALSRRHPGRLAPVELRPWPTAAAIAALSGRPRIVVVMVGALGAVLARSVGPRGIPAWLIIRWSVGAVGWTVVGLGKALTVLTGPALILALLRSRRMATPVLVLVLAPPVTEWLRRRPPLDPIRWSLASVADDMSYGAGVWAGCVRSRSFGPVVPVFRRRAVDTVPPVADEVAPVPPDVDEMV
jgi:mycofactocin system glycosyltransferase